MGREYKLAADPARHGPRQMREILEFADGHRSVILVVDDRDAIDVRDALARVYQDSREDNAPHYHSATGTENTPCWCPSPLAYARQGNGEYGSDGDEPEPITDVPMVCTECRNPVVSNGYGWIHLTVIDGTRCSASLLGIKAMVAAGNEKISSKGER